MKIAMKRFELRPACRDDHSDLVSLAGELGSLDTFPAVEEWLERVAPHTLVASDGEVVGHVVAFPTGDEAMLSDAPPDSTGWAPRHLRRQGWITVLRHPRDARCMRQT